MGEDAVLGKSKAVKRIVSDSLIRESMSLSQKLSAAGNDHPKMGELKKLVGKQIRINPDSKIIIFSNYRNTVANIVSTLREVEGCKPVAFVGQATRYDVGMKQKEQMERLEQFSQGEHNCLIGTSISEEGLHVPAVDLAIFYEPVPSEIRTIQRRGRVGRTKVGKIVLDTWPELPPLEQEEQPEPVPSLYSMLISLPSLRKINTHITIDQISTKIQ